MCGLLFLLTVFILVTNECNDTADMAVKYMKRFVIIVTLTDFFLLSDAVVSLSALIGRDKENSLFFSFLCVHFVINKHKTVVEWTLFEWLPNTSSSELKLE